jgi:hypothetical protein
MDYNDIIIITLLVVIIALLLVKKDNLFFSKQENLEIQNDLYDKNIKINNKIEKTHKNIEYNNDTNSLLDDELNSLMDIYGKNKKMSEKKYKKNNKINKKPNKKVIIDDYFDYDNIKSLNSMDNTLHDLVSIVEKNN